ncbi:MAG: tRNA (adenosine(37)-N6)-threonylcarbamoyltransferase complex dimerization subunit type 1 TsaB [Candidatus Azobacteroides sp.]|nr:tRNA (adenosine(37)-N6)-threonylcarbamoyltransferase complex dimerization subunit type 1 TsaB [Candidatus Azobacteroides sp.]
MPCILHIETSTEVCSVALSENNQLLFYKESDREMSHSSLLGTYVKEAMETGFTHNKRPDAIAISCGPGSYTGLRIGTSMAKGLCYGLNIPLIAIPTLQVMTYPVIKEGKYSSFLFCPMIDARRMEVYTALYDKNLSVIEDTTAKIIDENSFRNKLSTNKVVFFGNGAEKCKAIINHPNAFFIENIYPLAKNMLSLSKEKFIQKEFMDVAYFEPYYLKDFIATTPKNKIF